MTLTKPAWWDELATRYGFANDSSSTIGEQSLFEILYASVRPAPSLMLSPEFLALQTQIIAASPETLNESNILVSDTGVGDMMIGYGSADSLSGRAGDDILYGGAGDDVFSPGAGIDFVVGSDEHGSNVERDTAGYLSALSAITVEAEQFAPPVTGGAGTLVLAPGQDYYAYSYADWVDPSVPKISGFQTGAGGDLIDVSALLTHVGYTGSNPVGDGYVRFSNVTGGMKIQFDGDGIGGAGPRELVRLLGVTVAQFSASDNLIVTPVVITQPPKVTDYYALVSDDGQGSYDVLYSVENIVGSDFNDVIHGQARAGNSLLGGLGNDWLYGEGGDDVLVGGAGTNVLYGGTGNDVLVFGEGSDTAQGGAGTDRFSFLALDTSLSATILDFQVGAGGDRLDVSAFLDKAGYAGSNALADGYISLLQQGADTRVMVDMDGAAGPGAEFQIALLQGIQAGTISASENLTTNAPHTLLVSVLGQSNAAGLRVFGNDTESGLTRLQSGLESTTDFDRVVTLPQDEYNAVVSLAVGGSRVDGNTVWPTSAVWWYPNEAKPGEALIRAVETLGVQIASLRAQGVVTPTIVWGQGESDAVLIGQWDTPAERQAAQQRYMEATSAVFDYIKARLGSDIEFYVMQTGGYSIGGAAALGTSASESADIVAGLPYIRAAQEALVLAREDVHMGAGYTDLPMYYETTGAADEWHYGPEEREIVGDRLAAFIAFDQGYDTDFVLDNLGAYPLRALDDLHLAAGSGVVRAGNAADNIVIGTLGADTLSGGAGGNDALYGGAGDDRYLLTSGLDTVVDNGGVDTVVLDFSMAGFGSVLTTLAQGNDLRLVIDSGARDLVLKDQLSATAAYHMEILQFTDGALSLDSAGAWLFAPAAGGTVTGDPFGAERADIIFGSANGDVLKSLGGDDTLYGFGGADELWGGAGNDFLYGGDGDDLKMRGEAGNDTLYGEGGNDDVRGGDGEDVLYGGLGNDRVEGDNGNDVVYGQEGDDILRGRLGDDTLYGGDGADDVRGQEGNDILYGGAGNDTLDGGAGDDRFHTRDGEADRITCGEGNDTALLDNVDIITDI
ncbi:MAG TPA: type I secretion C-terminal target domain-containing protein, partial [Alphaproteobacteria bacterium]|nr:type I secretion C-terminal target domain-containing protein [Alphaproteobacteria bacterium]